MSAPSASTPGCGFDAHFESAKINIFRLETLQCYGNSGEDPALAAFEAGEPHLITPAKHEWLTGYAPNVDAGEDIRIIPVPPGTPWPAALPERTDFWLFDLTTLYALRYDPDGSWIAAEQLTEPAAIHQARRWRETALQLATPWRLYTDSHPDLADVVGQLKTP